MKAELYRESPVLTSYLETRGEAKKYPVYVPNPKTEPEGWSLFRVVPAGYVIDHPDAWRLVRQGTAKAADDECKKRANMTSDQLIHRYERQKLLEAGKLTGDPELDAPDPS